MNCLYIAKQYLQDTSKVRNVTLKAHLKSMGKALCTAQYLCDALPVPVSFSNVGENLTPIDMKTYESL
jgi:hypothetical protein